MLIIKKMETEAEIRGRAFVHYQSWQEAYSGLIGREYLERQTLEVCEKIAYDWPDHILIAKDSERVVGFLGYGIRDEAPGIGEIFSLYVLSEYYGKDVGRRLMEAGLQELKDYPVIHLWVLKENYRARRFYEKCGFRPDGAEMHEPRIDAPEIRMTLKR